MEDGLSGGQKLDLRIKGDGFGVKVGGGCRFKLQRRYEESEQLLDIVHRIKAGGCRERWKGTTSMVYLLVQEPSERERQDGWRLEGGHLETGWGTGGTKPIVSLTVEHIFSVAGPDLVVCLLMGKGAGSCGITGHHVKACISQLVKSLLQKGELEIVAGCVALRGAVRVTALVQCLPKHLFGQGDLSTHHDPCHPAEFGIGVAVTAQGV